jgi:hypothetical protein
MEDTLNLIQNGRLLQKKIKKMQPQKFQIKTMVVAPLQVTYFLKMPFEISKTI